MDVSAIKEKSQPQRPPSGRREARPAAIRHRAAGRPKRKLILKTVEFEGITNAFWPGERQCDIAERLGVDVSSWSQMRSGTRYLSDGVVAAVLELLPDLPIKAYAISVRSRDAV